MMVPLEKLIHPDNLEVVFYPSGRFTLGEFNGVPLLHYYGYDKYRNDYFNSLFEQFGLVKYYLRHGDDGDFVEPVSIEQDYVYVNYCGCIFMPVRLEEKFPDRVYYTTLQDGSKRLCVFLTDEEGSDIVFGEEIEFWDFMNSISKTEI